MKRSHWRRDVEGSEERYRQRDDDQMKWRQNFEHSSRHHDDHRGAKRKRMLDLPTSKTGGAYTPPAKLSMLQEGIPDKSGVIYQIVAWQALKKSIRGWIDKINAGNVGVVARELLRENIVRGRGLLAQSIIQAQAASPKSTPVYAALVSLINSKFQDVGELVLRRLVLRFKRGLKTNDKPLCVSSGTFMAHLVNQRVAHKIVALEISSLLLKTPTDDSVEVAVAFLKECGMKLTEVSPRGAEAIFETLRNILHEGQLDKRVQYMIEVMLLIRKYGFKDHEAVPEELDLVEKGNQITHRIRLEDKMSAQNKLNVFEFDAEYLASEERYKQLRKEGLGSDASDSEGDDEDGEEEGSDEGSGAERTEGREGAILDNTETNLTAIYLRRAICLRIQSLLDFDKCAHKLKTRLKPGQEMWLCHVFLDCYADMRKYEKFFGSLAGRLCAVKKMYVAPFEQIFRDSYRTIHRLDADKLRNVPKFFAHLLLMDSISWSVLSCIKLNEEDTTSSSRVFIRILFQELADYMGLAKLNERVKDPTLQDAFEGLFPRDDPRNTRFAIHFFTSIGLDGLTDDLREHLKSHPKPTAVITPMALPIKEKELPNSDDSVSVSSSRSSNSFSYSSSSPYPYFSASSSSED